MKDIMTTTTPPRIRLSRLIADRIAYREKASFFLSELVGFGILVFVAGWPIIQLISAMARTVR